MNRYTEKQLCKDVSEINEKLKRLGSQYLLGLGNAYNRVELDLCTPEQLAAHCRQRMLACGSPRECLAAANEYLVSKI